MKSKYQIGDWVEVTAIVIFGYEDSLERKPIREIQKEPFTAQVIGAVYRQIGVCHEGSYDPYDGGGQRYFECKGTVLVYLVRRGMINRPVEVLPKDSRLCKKKDYTRLLPWRYQRSKCAK